MATREEIRTRQDVDEDDVDDVVGLAAQLQAAARAEQDDRASVDEVKDVAAELDIAPQFVEQAITKLKGDREAALRARAEAEKRAASEAALARSRRSAAAAIAGTLLLVAALAVGGLGMAGRSAVVEAQHVAEQHEADLIGVLDRQRSLVPQIAALSGAQLDVPALPADATVEQRLAAADALGAELTRAFAALPPSADEAANQQRLNLSYEIAGAQNRIDFARKGWDDANRAWAAAADSPSGRVAVVLGMADAPR